MLVDSSQFVPSLFFLIMYNSTITVRIGMKNFHNIFLKFYIVRWMPPSGNSLVITFTRAPSLVLLVVNNPIKAYSCPIMK